jgi:transmembrane sensor
MAKKISVEDAQDLLKRYRAGQCTEKELEIINQWYQSFEKAGADETLANSGDLDTLKKEMFETINNKIDKQEQAPAILSDRNSKVRKLYPWGFGVISRIAAVLLLSTTVALFFYKRTQDTGARLQSSTTPASSEKLASPILKASKPSTVYLSDGSVVWLKKGSTLEYPKTFAPNIREVMLTGEAFFDVAKNPERPFVIHASNFTTRVVGTTFNIKAYGNDDLDEVVVVTGKVVVTVKEQASDKVKELILHPNRKAVYSRTNHSLVESAAGGNATNIALDKRKLAFDETSLEDIIKVLNATYGIGISLSTERMNHCIVTADLTNEPIEVALAVLSKAINATYAIDGKNIVLRGSGCEIQP